jgi:hypothetical protein
MDSAADLEQVFSSKEPISGRHPVFWFDDGSLVLRVETVMFKVHRALLTRHSPFLSSTGSLKSRNDMISELSDEYYAEIDPARKVSVIDVEVLLEHLYHDM